MCGVNGIVWVGVASAALPPPSISAMNEALAHRGPDGAGEFVKPGVALGHRRLAIIDLSEAGHQPMHSADGGLTLVFNGEIYNYLELAAELATCGRVMRSHSDSEVILHAYAEWGDDCVQRFNGMWAFAIWDAPRRRLFASRDRLGVKPFVYTQRDGWLYFSSEPAGLRAALPLHDANLGKVYEFLAYGYRRNDGETFFDGVSELRPGHNLVLEGGQLALRRYWSLPPPGAPAFTGDARKRLHELLADAVRLRLRSDVPVALLQSGGLDSSAIAVLVDAEVEQGRLGAGPVTAFTAVHPGHHFDETESVRELLRRLPHVRSVELQPPGAALTEHLANYVRALQEPQASATSFAHWWLMQAVREQGIKVVINGQGADEAFAGYDNHTPGYRLLDLLLVAPKRALAEALAIERRLRRGWGWLFMQTAKAMLGRRAASAWRSWFTDGGARVLRPAFRRAHCARLPEVAMTLSPSNLDRHLRSQLLDYGFNQILNYEDYSSMSQGIEIRSPFVDYRLIEFAFSLPDEAKYSQGVTKRVVRDAFRADLPASIVDAPVKNGFATPFEQWAQSPAFGEFVRGLVNTPEFQASAVWDARRLGPMLTDPQAAARGFPVWRYVVVALWLRENGIRNAAQQGFADPARVSQRPASPSAAGVGRTRGDL